jgi:hypothetical protein
MLGGDRAGAKGPWLYIVLPTGATVVGPTVTYIPIYICMRFGIPCDHLYARVTKHYHLAFDHWFETLALLCIARGHVVTMCPRALVVRG